MVPFGEYWAAQPENSPIKKLFHAMAAYYDDYSDPATMIEAVYCAMEGAGSLADMRARHKQSHHGELSTLSWTIAAALLKSNVHISGALVGELIESIIRDGEELRGNIPSLGIKPAKKGRPATDRRRAGYRILTVHRLIEAGHNKTEAYRIVAESCNKSPDTIRREYERRKKRQPRHGAK